MSVRKILNHQLSFIFIIFCLSLTIRTFGLNWDQDQHLHPDERFLTMLVSTIKFPNSVSQYFNTSSSPLNPFNYKEFKFFVYGTFPLFLTKIIAFIFHFDNYQNIHFVGRILSAIFDSLNVFSLYFLVKLLLPKNKKIYIFLPSIFYAFTVLPIQLSHFFTVDTFLSFFLLLSFVLLSYWLKTQKSIYILFAAITFGLSLSCKLSATLFSPVIFLSFIYQIYKKRPKIFAELFSFILISFIVFRIFQPYSFIGYIKINPDLINSLTSLKGILASRDVFYPPEIQWLNKTAILFPLQNIVFFGLGLPLSFLLFLTIKNIFSVKKRKCISSPENFILFLSIFWTLFLFVEQGLQFTHTMRYFLPIYPFICLLVVLLNLSFVSHRRLFTYTLIFHLFYCLMFLNIYTKPHTRIQASNWIIKNISTKKVLSSEYWDDALPVGYSDYQNISLSFYDSESNEKWEKIDSSLSRIDYLIMSSNRLWGSIPLVPDRYPITTKFYHNLFDGKLDFKKAVEYNSYPGFSLPFLKLCYYFGPTNYPSVKNTWFSIDRDCFYPGIYLRDDVAEEAFTVYDHPKVLIFKKLLDE